ncbi:MAG: protein jag, partial [Sulfurimonas sp.]|nr:protein jag [Sulfurimonas sp.]
SSSNAKAKLEKQKQKKRPKYDKKKSEHNLLNDTIMPESFVSTQDDEDYDMADINFTADYEEDDAQEEAAKDTVRASDVAKQIETEINTLFESICFKIDKIDVSAYDDSTLLIEFKGEDAALLIGKEGYRYKALSYMIFNWINTKYQLQLRLEIAEFLKNQEEAVNRYLVGVCENIERDGRAQTKILDAVLVQIALKELRAKYPNKYVAIRSTRDGLKFIIINDYHN